MLCTTTQRARSCRRCHIHIPCDIWIPAARPDVINAANVSRLRTRMVAQGANIPCTPEAEQALHERSVLVLPDFVANAGGVICSAIEYQGGTEKAAFDYIDERIRTNTRIILDDARRGGMPPRAAALAFATDGAGSRGDAPLALMVRAMVIAGEGHPVQIGFIISPPCPEFAPRNPKHVPSTACNSGHWNVKTTDLRNINVEQLIRPYKFKMLPIRRRDRRLAKARWT